MTNEPRLVDKVALVFGGSRGIGAAIVKQLASDGASVALTYAKSPDKAAETWKKRMAQLQEQNRVQKSKTETKQQFERAIQDDNLSKRSE